MCPKDQVNALGISNAELSVLVVDDSDFVRTAAEKLLAKLGVGKIHLAGSGRQAIDIMCADETRIDVVVTDLMMADGDGIEVLRATSNMEIKPAFVFASGAQSQLLSTAERLAVIRRVRVLGTIEKPITLEKLSPLLEAARMPDTRFQTGFERPPVSPEDILEGLEQNQLLIVFQPKIGVSRKTVASAEVLVRWAHPTHGLIGPVFFVPVAENAGLIARITERVIDLAFRQKCEWHHEGFDLNLSINISALDLEDVLLPDKIAEKAKENFIDPQSITFEVTESGVIADMANALDVLTRIHLKGFKLSIDDFGTGYSSLEQLGRIPFDELKIDRAFVSPAAEVAKARAIFESSVQLAKRLGLKTVAEGVEDDAMLALLKDYAVDEAQGFLFSKPMTAADFRDWYAAFQSKDD